MTPGLLQPILRSILQPVLFQGSSPIPTAGARGYNLIDLTTPTLDPRITFTRASTKTYYDINGTLQSAANNVSPLEYDPITHALLGRTFWEVRTNLVLNSATMSTQNITTTATTYTLSFTGTGTVTLSGTSTGSLVGTGANVRVSKTFIPTAGTLTLTVSGSVTLAQCEVGAMAGPYIPTTATAVTSAVDSATISSLASCGLSATSGTIYVEATLAAAVTVSSGINTAVSLSNNTNTMTLGATMVPGAVIRERVVTSSVQVAANDAPALSFGAAAKIAYTYAASNYSLCVNGGTVVTTSSGTLPTLSQLDIGRTGGINTRQWCAPIRIIRCYGRVLSAAELQAITH